MTHKKAKTLMTVVILIVVIAIAIFFWDRSLEQRYQERTAKAGDIALQFAKDKCLKSTYKDQCSKLRAYPPGDWMPVGRDQGWSFTVKSNRSDPEKVFYYNVVVVRLRDTDTYSIGEYRDMNSGE